MRAVRPTVEAIGALWLGLVLFDGFQTSRSHVYKVELSLTVVENMTPCAHNIRYVTSSREQNKLSEFELPKV